MTDNAAAPPQPPAPPAPVAHPLTAKIQRWVLAVGSLLAVATIGAIGESGADGGLIKDVWAMAKTASPLGCCGAILLAIDAMAKRESADRRADVSHQRERDMALQYVQSMNAAGNKIEELGKAYGTLSTLVVNHLITRRRSST